jgi:hypothetical protein
MAKKSLFRVSSGRRIDIRIKQEYFDRFQVNPASDLSPSHWSRDLAASWKLVEPAGNFQLFVGVIVPGFTSRRTVDEPSLLGKTNVIRTLIATFRAFSAAQETVLPRVLVLPPGCRKIETISPGMGTMV